MQTRHSAGNEPTCRTADRVDERARHRLGGAALRASAFARDATRRRDECPPGQRISQIMPEFDEREIEFGRAAVAMMVEGYTCGSLPVASDLCLARIPAKCSRASPARRSASCRRRPAGRCGGSKKSKEEGHDWPPSVRWPIMSQHETYLGDGLYASWDGWQLRRCGRRAKAGIMVFLEDGLSRLEFVFVSYREWFKLSSPRFLSHARHDCSGIVLGWLLG
jgi:hypothetical protein